MGQIRHDCDQPGKIRRRLCGQTCGSSPKQRDNVPIWPEPSKHFGSYLPILRQLHREKTLSCVRHFSSRTEWAITEEKSNDCSSVEADRGQGKTNGRV
ncbi:MAG: hypothetical protein AAFY25_07365 [Pseudomonadota bacterium]